MRPKDFDVGKVCKSKDLTVILAKISSEKVVILKPSTILGELRMTDFWSDGYTGIPLSDLNKNQMEVYLKHFPETKVDLVGCTCSNDQLFNGGCKCGFFQKERA